MVGVVLAGAANAYLLNAAVLPASLALAGAVAVRRRFPVAAYVAVLAIGAAQVAVGIGSKFTDSPLQPTFADVAILILLYTVAAERPRRISLPALAACVVLFAAMVVRYNPGGNVGQPRHQVEFFLVTALLYLLAPLSAWVLGDSMGYRRAYSAALEERAARAERERDAQAQIAAAAERARIARELHDVIAHNLSVMVAQADGGTYAFDATPERSRQALAEIGRTGRQALSEMSSLLGVLRTDPEAPPLARDCPADVMVMDVRMPGLDGVAATREICQAGERPRVLILTTFDLDEYAFAALRAGASGFLLKSAPPEELLYAIRSVHNGDSVVAPSTTRRLIGRFLPHLPAAGAPAREGLADLTVREREVLAEVGSGLSNTEIAALLHISEATVKTHVGHIMAKLGLRDRIQAVVYAYETGLIAPQGRANSG